MAEPPIDLRKFILTLVENAYNSMKSASDGLTDDQMHYRPTSDTNSIAWLAWHLSRARDQITAAISNEPEVWVAEGWAERFGMTPERNGIGDTPEQVDAFQPGRELLFGYVDAAHRVTVDRVTRMPLARLDEPIVYLLGDTRPTWRALTGMIGDSTQHNGQINYLRGMVTGIGWKSA